MQSGLQIKPETMKEIGEVLEIKVDQKNKEYKYIAHSFYYECDVSFEIVKTEMTENELSKGYQFEWAELEKIISENMQRQKEDWIIRDTEFMKRYFG